MNDGEVQGLSPEEEAGLAWHSMRFLYEQNVRLREGFSDHRDLGVHLHDIVVEQATSVPGI